MSIHIVTHVYSTLLPQYAVFLRAQLSSLFLRRKEAQISVTVCYSPDDVAVCRVLEDFSTDLDSLRIIQCPLSEESLFRRSIGRNQAGLSSDCDLVWYTDVDHYFGVGCLSTLEEIWSKYKTKPVLMWPQEIKIHKDHLTGDQFWKNDAEERIGRYRDQGSGDDFVLKKYDRAIGGVQIVSGNFSRKHGYLKSQPKWLEPLTDISKPFPCFQDDVKFRKECQSKGLSCPIDLPNLYRFRHTETTYQ